MKIEVQAKQNKDETIMLEISFEEPMMKVISCISYQEAKKVLSDLEDEIAYVKRKMGLK